MYYTIHAMCSVIIAMEQITYVHQEINWIIMGLIRMVKKHKNKPLSLSQP